MTEIENRVDMDAIFVSCASGEASFSRAVRFTAVSRVPGPTGPRRDEEQHQARLVEDDGDVLPHTPGDGTRRIPTHPQVWVASGHVGAADPMVCNCQARFRAEDEVDNTRARTAGAVGSSPRRGCSTAVQDVRRAVEDEASVVYLRPETAQGMFVSSLRTC